MSDLIKALLEIDKSKLVRPTKKVKAKRLSELAGKEVIITVQALTPSEEKDINDKAFKIGKKNKIDFDTELNKKLTLIKGISDLNLLDKELQKHFGATNSHDLIDKLFLPGEQESIYEAIKELSGYDEDTIEEIKN
ncbi:phage XkdN-like protein [Gottschalkia purinilytica]|uniref:Phage XkdN-like protein n=1 Tax=Gottschalkia purinilytica TaxID=1503 RepID=A0A0L0W6S6_GOTPU|nr:hypothetical protein [Gottschalkia purinilytica]KNF07171.1 phage XkdN-like protein [Gottschalkia purinilytica]